MREPSIMDCPECVWKHLRDTEHHLEDLVREDKKYRKFWNDLIDDIRKQRKKLFEWMVKNPERCIRCEISSNPHRKYYPYGLTSYEKTHPRYLKKLSRCIKKVEKRHKCKPPYYFCPVNPVAVCRASVHKIGA